MSGRAPADPSSTAAADPTPPACRFLQEGGRSIVPVGAHFVPTAGPDWTGRVDVQSFEEAFARMASLGLDSVRIDVLWAAVEPDEGRYDDAHLEQLDAILAGARRHGLRLHPALLIGGEVGDAYWDIPWRNGRHPHADAALRSRQAAHVAMLARRWAGEAGILAWDLTDEPPLWLFQDTQDEDAVAWTRELADAIRSTGAKQPITIGTASQEVDHGPFRVDTIAAHIDFACVHPYPIYSPELYPDRLLSARMTHAGAFETALAGGAGKPVMVHEYGASTTQFDPDLIAHYDRLTAWASFGRGAIGFFPWCWTDAEPPAYGRAPYVRMPHETQFGVTDWRGLPRPRARVLGELAATLARIDLDAYAANGPRAAAALLVPHEYVHPYDPASYGLDESAGNYVPAERAWSPKRDVEPLVRAWLNAFVMAARAGFSVGFPREALDHTWPTARLVLLPAPLTTTSNSLWHLRTSYWQRAPEFLETGGTVYLSLSADSAIPELHLLAGCRIVDRAPARQSDVLRFVKRWGTLQRGDEIALPAVPDDLRLRSVELATTDAEVIAVDADGKPALVVARRAQGQVVVCSTPIELLAARVPDAHGPADNCYALYTGLADLAGALDDAGVEHPQLSTGTLTGSAGGILVITNHGAEPVEATLRLPTSARTATLILPDATLPIESESIAAAGYGVAVITWRH